METMTSAFPWSTPSHNVKLDNIIFYPGPAPAKTRETTPIDADAWPDVSQHELVTTTGQLDPSSGFNVTGKGELWSQFLYSSMPSNTLEIRHPENN